MLFNWLKSVNKLYFNPPFLFYYPSVLNLHCHWAFMCNSDCGTEWHGYCKNKFKNTAQPITSTAHRDHLPSLVRTAEDSTYHSGLNYSESCHFITLYHVYVNHFLIPGIKTVVTASRSKTVVWTHQNEYMWQLAWCATALESFILWITFWMQGLNPCWCVHH